MQQGANVHSVLHLPIPCLGSQRKVNFRAKIWQSGPDDQTEPLLIHRSFGLAVPNAQACILCVIMMELAYLEKHYENCLGASRASSLRKPGARAGYRRFEISWALVNRQTWQTTILNKASSWRRPFFA